MSHYDVIIIGSGAGGGNAGPSSRARRARRDPAAGARRLAASRAAERLCLRRCSSTIATSPRTPGAMTPNGEVSAPQVHYFVGRRHQALRRRAVPLRAEDFGELRHHDGISPAWPIGYEEMEPYYTFAEQLLPGARRARTRTRPSRPASAPYPFPAVSHEPRIQKLSDDFAALGPPPVPRALRGDAQRGEHALQQRACAARLLRRLSRASCTPSQTPRCWASARRSSTTTSTLLIARRGAAIEHRTRPGNAVTGVVVDHDGSP